MKQGAFAAAVLLVAALHGCSGGDGPLDPAQPPAPPPPPPPGSDLALGQAAVERECGICHASRDGFDLAYFSYADTTIVRRAVKHVDTATALRIVAYIRSLNTAHVPAKVKLFQPGGTVVASDAQFAIDLFGSDTWPVLSTAQLRAIDPRVTPIAFSLPPWSDEQSNLDWLPDSAPPAAILSYNGNRAGAALTAYHTNPTTANLGAVVSAMRDAERAGANPAAPCLFNTPSRVNYVACFELRRWTAALIAQHMLRGGINQSVGGEAHEQWWDVGNTARMAQQASTPSAIVNPAVNQIDWMYLGWMFEPGLHESFYLENLLAGRGLRRHAVFVALRGQVSRPPNSWDEHQAIYDDLRMAVRHAPNSWTASVATFALNHLLERLNGGERPLTTANRTRAITQIDGAITEATPKVSAAQLQALVNLAAQIKAKL